MKLITLNCWGGRRYIPLLEFFERNKDTCDIFCLQEVFDAEQSVLDAKHADMQSLRGDLFRLISEVLREHRGFFAHFEDSNRMSTAIFVRKNISIHHAWDAVVYRPSVPKDTGKKIFSERKLQCMQLGLDDRGLLIANLHGLWDAGPKTDTPDRLEQSWKIRSILETHVGPSVLCGDFNLLPETESVRILSEGRQNLVEEHGVASTRTSLYRHYDNPKEPNFADYVILSSDLHVENFTVMPDQVSDHSPLHVSFK